MGNAIQRPKEHLSIWKKARQSPRVSMRGVLIPQVRTHRHLGLMLNESLTWKDHNISSVYTTCARMMILRPRGNHSFTSNEEDLHRSHPPSHGVCVRSVERRAHTTGCLQRLQDSFAKRNSLSLPPLEKRFEYHTLVSFQFIESVQT